MNGKAKLLGARIKEVRKRVGMSQDQLAEKTGIDSKYLSRIEVGKRDPSLDTLGHIADSLGVEIRELFDFAYLDDEATITKRIESRVKTASTDELHLIDRVISAVLR